MYYNFRHPHNLFKQIFKYSINKKGLNINIQILNSKLTMAPMLSKLYKSSRTNYINIIDRTMTSLIMNNDIRNTN